MATAALAVDQGEGKPTLWLKLLAFGAKADHLLEHRKGDALAAAGRLHLSEWTGREGKAR
jgi:single-stranded DNA-binding protein